MGFNPFDGLFGSGRNIPSPSQLGDASTGLWNVFGELQGAFTKWATNILPRELAASIKTGLENAGIGDIIGDSLRDIPLLNAKMRLLGVFKTMGDEMVKGWEKVDQAAFNYGKRIGLAGDQVVRLRNEMIKFGVEANTAIKYGKSIDELIKLQSDYSAVLGRNVRLTKQQFEDAAALSAVVGDDMAMKFSVQLENFGLSMTDAGDLMTQMFNKSVKQGISLEKYAQSVTDNLHLAQQYTFKNGVNGLTSMAEKAAKMRLDISEAVKLADKVSTVEGAVDVAAQLQVLGGAFSNFADPMGLLYDSLNNMEGMQDRLSELVGNFGSFNRQTGEIELATFDKLRLRQAASAMGVDYGKLIESATHQAKRGEIEYQMRGLTNIPEEYKELLMNTATFQNGVAGTVGADGTFKSLASLDGKDLKALADNSKTDSENIRDIAITLRGMSDIREGQAKAEEDARAGYFRSQAEIVKEGYQKIGENNKLLEQLIRLQFAKTVKDSIVSPAGNMAYGAITKLLEVLVTKKEHGGIIKTHSEGDVITNGIPGKEYVLNSAQYGEFIVNKQATAHHLGLLKAINADKNGSLKVKPHMLGGMPFMDNMTGVGLGSLVFNPNMFYQFANQQQESIKSNKELIKLLKLIQNNVVLTENGEKFLDRVQSRMEDNISDIEEKVSMTKKLGKGTRIATSVAGGALAGFGAWNNAAAQYEADGTNIMNKGKANGGKIGAAAGAAITTGLLNAIPLVGPLIAPVLGPTIGSAIGKVTGEAIGSGSRKRRSRIYDELEADLRTKNVGAANVFDSLKGDFSVKEMKSIAKALNDGKIRERELSGDLMEKIKMSGNYNNLVLQKYSSGGYIVGPSHKNGGVKINEAEGGEFIINKEATARSINTLSKINDGTINDSNIRAKEPMGKQVKVNEYYSNGGANERTIKMEPIKVDINGTIKLDTGSQSFDLSKELFNNPSFINKITDIITKQININDNGSFNKQTYYQRYSSI